MYTVIIRMIDGTQRTLENVSEDDLYNSFIGNFEESEWIEWSDSRGINLDLLIMK